MTAASFDFARWLAALEAQAQAYRTILDLSRRQAGLIAAGDSEGLMRLLGEKQQRIEAVQGLAGEVAGMQAAWEGGARESAPPALRTKIETAATALRGTLAEIVRLEDEGQAAMQGARAAAGNQITRLQQGKAMHKAYGGRAGGGTGRKA